MSSHLALAQHFAVKSVSGQPVENNVCVMVDSNLQTFTLQIHSTSTVDREILKTLIQQRFKVITLEKTSQTLLVK